MRVWIGMLLLCLANNVTLAQAAGTEKGLQRTISVRGSGNVNAAPDQIRFTLQVSARGETATSAIAEASKRTAQILSILKELKVDEKDIQTGRVAVTPIHDFEKRAQQNAIVGYTGSNDFSIMFKGKSGEDIGEFLDKAVAAGASKIGRLRFTSSQRRELEREALKKAAEDPRARGEALAKELGSVLGQVQSITESTFGSTRRVREEAVSLGEMASEESASTPVMSGELSVSAQVDVVFELK